MTGAGATPGGAGGRSGEDIPAGEAGRRPASPGGPPTDTEMGRALAVASSLQAARSEAVADPDREFTARLRERLLVEAAGLVRPQHPASGELKPAVAAATGLVDWLRRRDWLNWRPGWLRRRRAAIGLGAAVLLVAVLVGWVVGGILGGGQGRRDPAGRPPAIGDQPGTSPDGGGPTDSSQGVPPSTGGLPGVLPPTSTRPPRSTTTTRPVVTTTTRASATTRPASTSPTSTTLPATSTTLPDPTTSVTVTVTTVGS